MPVARPGVTPKCGKGYSTLSGNRISLVEVKITLCWGMICDYILNYGKLPKMPAPPKNKRPPEYMFPNILDAKFFPIIIPLNISPY